MPRPRLPAEVHRLTGTFRPHRHAVPPGAEGSDQPIGHPPRALPRNARVVWRETIQMAPWLRSSDRHAVEVYSTLMASFRADPTGLGGRPLAIMSSLAGRLGLVWSDRQRQRPDPVDKPTLDPVEEKYFRGSGL